MLNANPQVTTEAAYRGSSRVEGARTPPSTLDGGRGGQGWGGVSTSDPLPGESVDYVQELLKVAPPALARLLSFEHLR